MGLHIHVHVRYEKEGEILESLKKLTDLIIINNQKINQIMSNTDTALADLAAIGASLTKISGETTLLLQKITDLENTTTSDTPQAVLDAIEAVKAQATTIDDLVPDAPVTPPAQ